MDEKKRRRTIRTDEGENGEEEKNPRASPKEIVDGSVKDGDSGDYGGEHNLGSQDSVHFPYESPSELVLPMAKPRVQSLTRL